MNKAIVALMCVVLAAGAVFFVRHRQKKAVPEVRLVASRPASEIKLRCVHCRRGFALSEAKIVAGRQGVVLCPHCGQTTALGAEARTP